MLADAVVRTLPPAGGFLRDYIAYASERTDAPAAFHLGVGLTVLSAASGQNLRYESHGTVGITNLYTLLIGASGEDRKSTSIGIGKRMLEAEMHSLLGAQPASHEGLTEALGIQENQLIIYSEFSTLLATSEQQHMRPIRACFTDAYDGSRLSRKKAKGPPTIVEHPRISLLGGATLGHLEEFTTEVDWTGGFMNRFLPILGGRTVRRESQRENESERLRIAHLLSERYQAGNGVGLCTGMAPAAKAAYDTFASQVEAYKRQSRKRVELGMLARVTHHVYKLAVLFTHDMLTESLQPQYEIPADAMTAAVKMGESLFEDIRTLAERVAPNVWMQNRRRILDVLQGGKDLTLGQIIKQVAYLGKRDVVAHLESLVEEQAIARTTDPSGFAHESFKIIGPQGKELQ